MSNSTRHPFVHEMFQEAAQQHAGRTALANSDRHLTYAELDAWSNSIADYLLGLGAAKGSMIFIVAESSFSIISSMIAILKIGGIFVPLDPCQPAKRLQVLAGQVPPDYVVTEVGLLGKVASLFGVDVPVVAVDRTKSSEQQPCLLPRRTVAGVENAKPLPPSVSEPDDMCYVFFTSGSSGKPKAIAGRLKSIDHFIRWEIDTFAVRPGTIFSQITQPVFDAFLRDTFTPLCAGGTLRIPDSRETILDADRLCSWIHGSHIEFIHSVPSLFRAMLSADLTNDLFPHLRYVLLSGEPLLPSDVKRWTELFGDRIPLINLYGPTETTMIKLFYQVKPEDSARQNIPVGRPLPDTQAFLLDETGKPAGQGALGEIYIRTPYRTLGYYGDPELTAKLFVRNPLADDDNDIVYRTGDFGRVLEDGNIEFVGRNDQQVKVRGIRVELEEIESAIYGTGLVREAAVASRHDRLGNLFLCAYVALSEPVPVEEVRKAVLALLPEYLVPSAFVVLEALPHTASGKIDRNALPRLEAAHANVAAKHIAPRNEMEEEVSKIFSKVLGLEKIGVDEDFFLLGGQSLLATLVISRVRRSLKVDVPLRSLFEAPTVASLVEKIRSAVGGQAAEEAIQPLPRDATRPLSFAQQRLWFLEQFHPDSDVYNIVVPIRISGALEIDSLRRGLEEIVRRHEVLRSRFVMHQGEPLQQVMAAEPVPLPLFDISFLPALEQEAPLDHFLEKQVHRNFDLTQGPLFRVNLIRLGPQEHVLVLNMHHIVSDDWSLRVLMQELGQIYAAYLRHEPSPLPELPIQYADFSSWQRRWLRGEMLERQLAYWRKQLVALPTLLELPLDHPRPAVQSVHGSRISLQLTANVSDRLQTLSQSQEVTLFMTLLAAFQVLLLRYSGTEDLAVGTPIASRNRVEIEGLIGFFVNTLVLRADLRGNPTFTALLARVRETALGAYAHQDLPFEKLVEELKPERNLSHTPLFQVIFALQNASLSETTFAGLRLTPLPIDTGAIKFDLMMTAEEVANQGTLLQLTYSTDLFEASTMQRMLGHFENLLGSIVNSPEQHLSEMEMLSGAERAQLLVEWNATTRDYGPSVCVHKLFEAQAERTPNALAVEYEQQQMSYAELNERANQLAHYLRGLGVGPEIRVALCVERGLEMVVALLGVLKSGGAYVPLDPEYPPERLRFIAEDAQVSVLLTQSQARGRVPQVNARIVELDTGWEQIAGHSRANPPATAQPGNAAYVMYTSGSTGRPKGVVVIRRGLTNFVRAMNDIFSNSTPGHWIAVTSICFDISVLELLWTLAHGDHVILHPGLKRARQGVDVNGKKQELASSTEESWNYSGKSLQCTPSFMAGLIELWKTRPQRPVLKKLLLGGEALPPALARNLAGISQDGIYNMYGPTETTVWSSVYRLHEAEDSISIGRPVINTQMYVLDETMALAPTGVTGELYIGGTGLARGYWRQPGLTAERFVPNPFSVEAGERLYRTGDLVKRQANGNLEYLRRIDHQIKVRGYRIEPGEIQAVLAQHAEVKEAAVIAREYNNDKRLVAYVVCPARTNVTSLGLRQYLRDRLPDYMVPNVVVLLDRMPLTPNGKLDRQALPNPEEPAINAANSAIDRGNDLEQTIAAVWQNLLRTSKMRLDDNFFDLGGHSLLVIQMKSALLQTLNRDIAVIDLFSYPSIRSLARYLDQDHLVAIDLNPLQQRKERQREYLSRRKKHTLKETVS
jgi:amino acid adenylation domain-containing protein